VRTPSELADYIGITRPAASRLLKRMEARGFVTRASGDGDGRSVDLGLTDAAARCSTGPGRRLTR
jgi:DNA-binding MarR family transcriptional regulator